MHITSIAAIKRLNNDPHPTTTHLQSVYIQNKTIKLLFRKMARQHQEKIQHSCSLYTYIQSIQIEYYIFCLMLCTCTQTSTNPHIRAHTVGKNKDNIKMATKYRNRLIAFSYSFIYTKKKMLWVFIIVALVCDIVQDHFIVSIHMYKTDAVKECQQSGTRKRMLNWRIPKRARE